MPYSLKNSKMKFKLPISMLKPLINSLSPSTKSKGARFTSIRDKSSHNTIHNKTSSKGLQVSLVKDILLYIFIININNKIIDTSNLNPCRRLRSLPNLEYLLDLLHPVKTTTYALIPNTEKNNNPLCLKSIIQPLQGKIHIQMNINTKKIITGIIIYKKLKLLFKIKKFFKNNFTPSDTGCNLPKRLTLLGPRRD